MEQKQHRGPQVPFWEIRGGSRDHPTADTKAQPTSVALVGGAKASGRPTNDKRRQKKRTQWALGQEASSGNKRERKLTNEGPRKQGAGGDNQRTRMQDIRRFFEEKGGDKSPLLDRDMKEWKGGRAQSGPPLEAGSRREEKQDSI